MSSSQLWVHKAEAELLAWLDYCQASKISFDDTVVGQLKESVNKTYTRVQVTSKLLYWWRGQQGKFVRDPERPWVSW